MQPPYNPSLTATPLLDGNKWFISYYISGLRKNFFPPIYALPAFCPSPQEKKSNRRQNTALSAFSRFSLAILSQLNAACFGLSASISKRNKIKGF
jgi:hypothetical protein